MIEFKLINSIHNKLQINNDYLEQENLDIRKAILKKRYDIFPIGYERTKIYIKNDKINLIHPYSYKEPKLNSKIIYRGHSHKSKQKTDYCNHLYTYVPTCSDVKEMANKEYNFELPSILDVTFTFNNNGLISKINTNTYIYLDRFIKVQENEKIFNAEQQFNEIKYERTPKILEKKIESPLNGNKKNNTRMSQIEKFNARYKKQVIHKK